MVSVLFARTDSCRLLDDSRHHYHLLAKMMLVMFNLSLQEVMESDHKVRFISDSIMSIVFLRGCYVGARTLSGNQSRIVFLNCIHYYYFFIIIIFFFWGGG